ncbi:FAR1-RELATED SEQUENCE 5-like protein [Drosera capensis]
MENCYIRNMFEFFKKEWVASIQYTHDTISKNDDVIMYKVGLREIEEYKRRTVSYHLPQGRKITCSCHKFKSIGILCKHILYIMRKKKFSILPDWSILSRWTIESRCRVVEDRLGIMSTEEEKKALIWSIRFIFNMAIEGVKESSSCLQKLKQVLQDFIKEQETVRYPEVTTSPTDASSYGLSQADLLSQVCVKDPAGPVKTKGHPKVAKRIKSGLEESLVAAKQRTCRYCCAKGHYSAGCPKRKAEEATMRPKNAM